MSSLDRDWLRKEFNNLEERVIKASDKGYIEEVHKELELYILINIGRTLLSKPNISGEIIEFHPTILKEKEPLTKPDKLLHCSKCGAVGAHYCTGGQEQGKGWEAKDIPASF